MGNPKELYKITHSSPELKTVGDLLNDQNSVTHTYFGDPERFLAITDQNGETNKQRIIAKYMPDEESLKILPAMKLPLKVGTLLYIEYEKINETSFLTEGIEVVSTNEPAFKAAQLAKLEADIGYFQVNKPVDGEILKGSSQESFPEVTVWIWCRSLSPKSDEIGELTGQLIDLTPFIQKCTTNMGKNGGNWQISLPPLVCEQDSDRKWVLKKGSLDKYVTEKNTSIQGEGYVAQASIFDAKLSNENNELIRSQFYFHNTIRPNDLIFIRHETLDMEKEQRYNDNQDYYVNKDNIANRIYDMIGLVDINVQSVNPQSNDVSINISGRDLSKLFIEDGTYFYALENSQGMLKFAGQSEAKNPLVNRIFSDGGLQFLFLYMHSSISLILKFIIQQLANIEIIPDGLFSSYGDRVNKRFNVVDDKPKLVTKNQPEYKPQFKLEDASGIWKIVKLVIDDSVSRRRIQDSSFSSANGSLLNFVRTVAQEPLVEFYMDTYGDMYHLIVRKPPYNQKALISLIEGQVNTEDGTVETPPSIVDIEQEDVLQEILTMDDSQIYSWYHFFPTNLFFGDANSYSLSYLGALYFKEYAQIYGSKPFQQSHPYIPFIPYHNSNKEYSLYEQQAVQDLKYVVESSQYLPFTRKGTLVLNGDRRIKIGNVIRYKSTGEIFFVESVQQNYQITDNGIERTTTVQVARGMIEQLIYGVFYESESGAKKYVSYFNIINTDPVYEYKDITNKAIKTRKIKAKVGTDVNTPPVALLDVFTGMVKSEDIISEKDNTGMYHLEKYNKNPANKNLFIRFINGINRLGYTVHIGALSTQRTYAEQWSLKHNKKDPNFNPRNAEAGGSRHEHFAAIDINIINKKTRVRHGKNTSKEAWLATGVPTLAKSMGLQWAGGDGSFGRYIDRVHFQIVNSTEENDQFEEYTEEITTKEINRDKIFSNFKVNKFSFNFFHKNLQFDPGYRNVTSRNIFQNDEQGTPIAPVIKSTIKRK